MQLLISVEAFSELVVLVGSHTVLHDLPSSVTTEFCLAITYL